jgi:hypothetical protein
MNPAFSPVDRAEAPLFADGLGERVVAADATTGELLQILRLRPVLTAVPSFEFALRERAARLANFRHAYYARVRRVDRVPSTGTLAIVSDHVEGTRLSDILRVAHARGLQLDTNAALCLIRQLVPAVALLHENARDASHGLLAPERLVVTPHARLVIVEHVAGSAIEQLQYGRERLWQEFRVAMPSSAGVARFDHRADVSGIGITALSLVLGRPLAADEFPHAIPGLLMQARERTSYGEERPLSPAFRNWLARTLQLDVRRSFASAPEALAGLEETLAGDSTYVAAPVALEAFLTQYLAAMLAPAPHVPAASAPAAPRPVPAASAPSPVRTAPSQGTGRPDPAAAAAAPALHAVDPGRADASLPGRSAAAPVAAPQSGPVRAPTAAPAVPEPPAGPPAHAARDAGSPSEGHQSRAAGGTTTGTFSVNDLPTIADLIKVGDLQKTSAPAAPRQVPVAPPESPVPPSSPVRFEGMDEMIGGARRDAAPEDAEPMPAAPGPPRSRARLLAMAAAAVLVLGGAAATWYFGGRAAAAPGLGTLVVQSSPAGVEIFVDGVSRGMTPANISVPAGSHILELRGRGVPRVIPLQVPAGGQVSQYLEFADTPLTGMLVVHSQPAGAKVSVDGVPRGVAPLTLEGLSPGDHEVTLQSDAGTSRHTVKVLAGTTASLVAPVIPAPAEGPVSGWISVKAPFTIEVREGGTLVGTSESDRLMMAAGRHEVELVNETLGYREARVLQIVPGKVLPLPVVLPKGTVNLNAAPWAEVWIDGTRVGDTPMGNLQVPIGPHEVVFRHPQFGEQRHAISVTAGAPVRLSVTMTK